LLQKAYALAFFLFLQDVTSVSFGGVTSFANATPLLLSIH